MAGASEAEVLTVVDNVKELVKQNTDLFITQKQTLLQVQNLCEGLDKLGAFINRERGNMKLEKLVISSIRELVLEAEEAIEMCVVVMMTKSKNTGKRSNRGFHKGDEDEEIKDMDLRLQKVGEKFYQLFLKFDRLELLKFSKKKDQRWNDKALFSGDDKQLVVGEDQVEKVIGLLESNSVASNNLEVISITGMIGSGKTTLARRVFKHSTLESLFSLRAFVSVPQEQSKKKVNVWLEILRQFGEEEEISGKEEAEIAEILGDCLNNSSFLIVLDDVCGTEVLDEIKSLVAQQQQGNQEKQRKVVLVVRTRRMGIYKNNQYELRRLDQKESQELLRMEIFGEKDKKCSLEIELLEMKILEKCYGLPLAVISFARILARRREKIEWWKKVAEHVNVFTDEESLMGKAIRAIFDGLNDKSKLCFLYLGVFEKDFEIPVRDLLRLWVAEGFVTGEEANGNNKSIEDVAEDYLEELVDRNLVMVEKRRSNGKIKLIKIHAGLDDFCKSEAKEENIFRESFFSESCRRFSIRNSFVSQFSNSVPESTTPPTNSPRSILYFCNHPIISSPGKKPVHIPEPLFKVIIKKVTKPFRKKRTKPSGILPAGDLFNLFLSSVPKTFKLLRVLDVRSFKLTEFPTALFSLILLRYVAVSCNSSSLPEELSSLCNLQTLIIRTSPESETLEIRADVRDMPLLRHIHCNKPILLRILRTAGNNQNLRTISRISPKSCRKELFETIPNLEKLGVFGNLSMEGGDCTTTPYNNNEDFFENIMKLNRLRNLKLLNEGANESGDEDEDEDEDEGEDKKDKNKGKGLKDKDKGKGEDKDKDKDKDKDEDKGEDEGEGEGEGDFTYLQYVLPSITPGSFHNLTNLTLSNAYLAGEKMTSIGKMENLEILKLHHTIFENGFWECEDGGFPKLRVLRLKVTNLKKWIAAGNHFPRLASLFLWHCNNLEILPVGLPDMQCLETVDVSFGHGGLASTLRAILSPKLKNQPGFDLTVFPLYK